MYRLARSNFGSRCASQLRCTPELLNWGCVRNVSCYLVEARVINKDPRPDSLELPSPPGALSRSPWNTGITVELSEVQQVGDDRTFGEYDYFNILKQYYPFSGGVSPLDQDCPNSDQCNGVLTRVRHVHSLPFWLPKLVSFSYFTHIL